MIKRIPALLLTLAFGACGGGGSPSPATPSTPSAGSQCTTLDQVSFVRETLQDIYLWYDQLPDPDPAGFDSPEAYLQAVRVLPIDSSYSYITGKAESDAFFSDSQFIGVGVSFRQISATEVRVTQIFPGGPAAEAGLARSDYLVSIDGVAVSELLQTGAFNTAFGPSEVGVSVTVAWRTPGGEQHEASLTKRLVTIPTVSATALFDVGGARVGYIFFRNFVTPSIAALNDAFDQLLADGATDLVLDLRYNGGGFVDVATHLGGLIGGQGTEGKVMVHFRHNDKNTNRDDDYLFPGRANSLNLTRLVVITTGGSASASELIVNGLRPFMDVTVVGSRTFGKPVGQYGFDFCDKVLYPVSFVGENALGEADYFDGIPADCAAPDDLDRQIADPAEASLAEALHVIRTGRCSGRAAAEVELRARAGEILPQLYAADPWRQLIGAH